MNKDIILLDLFSGIGGFSKGLSDAGFNITKHYFSEIDKHAIAVYKYQFKNSEYVGSVTDLDGRTITRPNIITFGSPCQDFSVAGKRAGMEGQRSSLIGEALKLITECRPDVFIWENVKGVFSSNSGADFWAIIQAFANIGGYRLEWQLLNTSWFLPQNRERIYLIGHLAESKRNFRQVFPIEQNSREDDDKQESNETTNIRTLSAGGHSGGNHSSMTILDFSHRNEGIREYDDISPTLSARDYKEPRIVAQRGREEKVLSPKRTEYGKKIRKKYEKGEIIEQRKHIQQLEPRNDGNTNTLTGVQKDNLIQVCDYRGDEGLRTRKDGLSPTLQARAREDKWGMPMVFAGGLNEHNRGDGSLSRDYSQQDRVYDADKSKEAATVAATMNSKYLSQSKIRRLTPIECERLQGFPSDWTLMGNYDGVIKIVSDSQRYKMCGNAVTCRVVEEIGIRLLGLKL